MDEDDDMMFNAEVSMQESVTGNFDYVPSSVDFNSKIPILEADLSYIMQNAIIDTEKNVRKSGSELSSEESSDDDAIKITLVKDKNRNNTPKDIVVLSSSSEDEENKNNQRTVSGKNVSDENIVNNLLSNLVRKTVRLSRVVGGDVDGLLRSSDSDSEACDVTELFKIKEREHQVVDNVPRVQNEVLPEEMNIEVEEIVLTPEDHLSQIGVISGIVDKMVVVKSNNDAPALDCESAFFLEDRSYVGKVFDTFGPVKIPYYTINLAKSLDSNKVSVGTKICYVPFNENITKYVFVAQLKKIKGSDASWRNDCEPPVNCVEYSDDEEERQAKREAKSKKSELTKINENNKNPNEPVNNSSTASHDRNKQSNNQYKQNRDRGEPNSARNSGKAKFNGNSYPHKHNNLPGPNMRNSSQSSDSQSTMIQRQPPRMPGPPPRMHGPPPRMHGPPPNMPGRPPNMPRQPPNMQVQPPNMQVQPPNMQVQPSNMQVQPSNMQRQPSNMQRQPPNMPVQPPNMPVQPPNMPVQPQFMPRQQPNMCGQRPNMLGQPNMPRQSPNMPGQPLNMPGQQLNMGIPPPNMQGQQHMAGQQLNMGIPPPNMQGQQNMHGQQNIRQSLAMSGQTQINPMQQNLNQSQPFNSPVMQQSQLTSNGLVNQNFQMGSMIRPTMQSQNVQHGINQNGIQAQVGFQNNNAFPTQFQQNQLPPNMQTNFNQMNNVMNSSLQRPMLQVPNNGFNNNGLVGNMNSNNSMVPPLNINQGQNPPLNYQNFQQGGHNNLQNNPQHQQNFSTQRGEVHDNPNGVRRLNGFTFKM